jgi:hypothetical protein
VVQALKPQQQPAAMRLAEIAEDEVAVRDRLRLPRRRP